MPLVDSRTPGGPRGPSGTFRRKSSVEPPQDRIGAIWSGNEKLGTEAVLNANMRGLAVMFSPTSDGGALGVHAWYGTRHWKDYCTSPEELAEVLEGLRDFKPSQPAPTPLGSHKARTTRSDDDRPRSGLSFATQNARQLWRAFARLKSLASGLLRLTS